MIRQLFYFAIDRKSYLALYERFIYLTLNKCKTIKDKLSYKRVTLRNSTYKSHSVSCIESIVAHLDVPYKERQRIGVLSS